MTEERLTKAGQNLVISDKTLTAQEDVVHETCPWYAYEGPTLSSDRTKYKQTDSFGITVLLTSSYFYINYLHSQMNCTVL